MLRRCHIDYETRSAVNLKQVGVYNYARHHTTQAYLCCYAFDDEPVKTWRLGDPMPDDLREHSEAGGLFIAHNSQFERVIWKITMRRQGWTNPPKLRQWQCTASRAAALALPRDLEGAAKALKLEHQKDMVGASLIVRMMKPRKPRKDEPADALLWWEDDERMDRAAAYCKDDVETERALDHACFQLIPDELESFYLDAVINDRGVKLDLSAIRAARAVADHATELLNAELFELTDGAVTSATKVADLRAWLASRGLYLDGLAKEIIADVLRLDDIPDDCRRALEIRQDVGKSSVKKLAAFIQFVCPDGRMRANLKWHAASTGRWAGQGAQLQNLPRLLVNPDKTKYTPDHAQAVRFILSRDAALLDAIYGSALKVISDCLRAMIVAGENAKLMGADFSNIEGRVLACLAGEMWKIRAFRDYDTVIGTDAKGKPITKGPDLYLLAAAGIYDTDIAGADPYRQIGKVAELALGYQGGVNAFQSMAANYGLKMAPAYASLWQRADTETRDAVDGRYRAALDDGRTTIGREEWIASELTKIAWRAKNPAIVSYWNDVERATIDAVARRGETIKLGALAFVVKRGYLLIRLPSGRTLAYASPKLQSRKTPWGKWKNVVTFMGQNAKTRQWHRQSGYGGHFVENITQAVARDLMRDAMSRLEAAKYYVVLTVHDEIISEVRKDFGDMDEFEALMCKRPTWAAAWPIVAKGWTGDRYSKG